MSFKSRVRNILAETPILDGLFRRFVWSRIHFPENEMRFLNSLPKDAFDVAIDVGAATGSYAWILNRVFRKVYAFEPGVKHSEYLNRASFMSKIKVISVAVGNSSKTVNFFTPGTDVDALHSATVSEANPVTEMKDTTIRQVPQIDLDSFFEKHLESGRSVDLIKVDVEGYENAVFEGCGELLKSHHPMIICEIEARHNPQYREVFDFLRLLGYVCYVFVDGKFELFADTDISQIQLEQDLAVRLAEEYDPRRNRYINNFVFQHKQSGIKVN